MTNVNTVVTSGRQAGGVFGRGHDGDFWGARNVLLLDQDGSYMGVWCVIIYALVHFSSLCYIS